MPDSIRLACGVGLALALFMGSAPAHAEPTTLTHEVRARQSAAETGAKLNDPQGMPVPNTPGATVTGADRESGVASTHRREQRATQALNLRQIRRAQQFDARQRSGSSSASNGRRDYLRQTFKAERRAQELRFKLNRR
ncbi:MAG: hypothetical protein ACR2RL_18245 [Gammaproteobacteria bacterium]